RTLPRCVNGSTPKGCCSKSKCSAHRCAAGNRTQHANWRRTVRRMRENMKTNTTGLVTRWAAIVLLTLSSVSRTALQAQDADAKDKEKAKIQRDQEREKARLEHDAERLYQQARKLANKGQWEEALKAFEQASQKGGDSADGALYW